MIITNRIYSFVLAISMIGSIAQISASENKLDENNEQVSLQQQNAIEQEAFDACLKLHADQLQELIMVVSDLQAIIVNNGIIVTNKREAIQSLQAMTMCMEALKEKLHLFTKMEDIAGLTTIISALIDHLQAAVNNGKDITPFNLEAAMTRGSSLIDGSEKFDEQMRKNADALTKLKSSSQSIGISWYNKAYRLFDSYIVQPGNKYNLLAPAFPYIGTTSELALSAAALASLVAYKFAYLDHTPEDLALEKDFKVNNPHYKANIVDATIANPHYGQAAQDGLNVTDPVIPNPHFGNTALNIKDATIPNQHRGSHPEKFEFELYKDADGKMSPLDRYKAIDLTAKPKADSYATTLYKKFVYHVRTTAGLGYPIRTKRGDIDYDGYHRTHPIGHVGNLESLCFGTPSLFLWLCARTAVPSWSVWKSFCVSADKKTKQLASFLKGGAHATKEIESGGTIIPKSTFTDVTGLTQAKELLGKLIPFFLDPESAVRAGRVPDLGYLFTGDPGNGKTFIVECLCGSIREAFIQAGKNPDDFKFYSLQASWLLNGSIRDLMQEAKQLAPCILFIDEFDLLQLQRTANAQKLAEFLVEINACFKSDPTKPVVIMTATNCPTHCDKALFRDGRLGTHIEFELPKKLDRKEFLTKKLSNLTFDITQFDIERLVLETDHLSYANIEGLINLAAMDAKLEKQLLQEKHIDRVLDYRFRSILFKSSSEQSPQEMALIAAHIAGKALTATLFSDLLERGIARATILPFMAKRNEELPGMALALPKERETPPAIEYGKLCTYNYYDRFNPHEYDNRHAHQFKALIQELLAGFVAEELLFNAPSTYSYNIKDENKAGLLALHMIAPGDSLAKMSEEQKNGMIQKAILLKEQCKKDVTELLTEFRPALELLHRVLMAEKILTGDEIKQVIAYAMNPKTVEEDTPTTAAAAA